MNLEILKKTMQIWPFRHSTDGQAQKEETNFSCDQLGDIKENRGGDLRGKIAIDDIDPTRQVQRNFPDGSTRRSKRVYNGRQTFGGGRGTHRTPSSCAMVTGFLLLRVNVGAFIITKSAHQHQEKIMLVL